MKFLKIKDIQFNSQKEQFSYLVNYHKTTMRTFTSLFLLLLLVFSCKDPADQTSTPEIESTDYYSETWRPQYHFTPETGWLNDPNGLVYHNGKYHLFYQYYPHATVWGPMHWGHAVSSDMLHWEHKPIALFPDEKGL